jgi:catechol-2,3-dioxygenase
MIFPSFVDHLVFRVEELGRTERFYNVLLGEPLHRSEEAIVYAVGDTRVFFTRASGAGTYDKEAVGLNHFALGVRTLGDLQAIESQLSGAAIKHSGIRVDRHGQKDYIWLDDPDGFRVEFYLRSE